MGTACQIHGSRVALRQLHKEDIEEYLRAFSPAVMQMLRASSHDEERRYLEAVCADHDFGRFFFVILEKSSNTIIGGIQFRDPERCASQCYCWINELYWGAGYFHEAVTLAVDEYFKCTGHTFIRAHVDIDNKRSYRAFKKEGFADFALVHGPYGQQYALVLRKK